MELNYDGKKNATDILERAKEYSAEIQILPGSNLFFGDNFDALSLLLKNGFENKIDLIYIDPPFNTAQAFFVDEDRKNTISSSRSGIIAYDDRLSTDDYLEFIRERVVLMHRLLSDEGSLYFHIDTKMGHYCKIILDEIFGQENFKNDITRVKSNPKNFFRKAFGNEKDVILFYAKNANKNIWNNITEPLDKDDLTKLYKKQDEKGYYTTIPLHAPGETANGATGMMWRNMLPPKGRHWRTDPAEFDRLDEQGLIEWSATGNPRIKKYAKDHKGKKIQDIWKFKDPQYPCYPTQKNADLLKRIIMQSSNKDSIVLDCFAGSGTTLSAADELGRVWIGVDNSKEAINAIKKRMLGKQYNMYCL